MKQTPEYDSIQRQMLPGVITLEGFLGTDTRKLIDILSEDDSAVRRSEKTHEQIAQRMQFFRDAGMPGLGEFMSIDDVFDVRVDSVRGKLPSPFGGPGMYGHHVHQAVLAAFRRGEIKNERRTGKRNKRHLINYSVF